MGSEIIEINSKTKPDDKHRIIDDFLFKLSKNLINHSVNYFDKYGEKEWDNCFYYSERGTYSVFSAALDKLTNIHLSEYSIHKKEDKRLSEENNKERAIDFWCNYRKKDFYIELKKNWIGLKTKEVGELNKITNVRRELKGQVKSVRSRIKAIHRNEDTNYKILGIHILTPYINNYDSEKTKFSKEDVIESLVEKYDQLYILNLPKKMHNIPYVDSNGDEKQAHTPFIILGIVC
jgi:hypothetical protein